MMWRDAVVRNGFAIVADVLDPDQIAELANGFAGACRGRSRAGLRHAMAIDCVSRVASGRELLSIAKDLLGDKAHPFRATVFDKSPTSNWLVTWHQDRALPLRERREVLGWGPWSVKDGVTYSHAPAELLSQVVAIRVHLDHSTEENGPLRVLPGTHTLGLLKEDEIRRLAETIESAVCTVAAGGVVIMRPLLLHASSKSQTDAPRRVLHIEYAGFSSLEEGLELAVCSRSD